MRMRATSEPPPGSVMASAAIFSPREHVGDDAPLQRLAAVGDDRRQADECENRLAIRPPLPARATSSVAIRRSRIVAGVPPYSSG